MPLAGLYVCTCMIVAEDHVLTIEKEACILRAHCDFGGLQTSSCQYPGASHQSVGAATWPLILCEKSGSLKKIVIG